MSATLDDFASHRVRVAARQRVVAASMRTPGESAACVDVSSDEKYLGDAVRAKANSEPFPLDPEGLRIDGVPEENARRATRSAKRAAGAGVEIIDLKTDVHRCRDRADHLEHLAQRLRAPRKRNVQDTLTLRVETDAPTALCAARVGKTDKDFFVHETTSVEARIALREANENNRRFKLKAQGARALRMDIGVYWSRAVLEHKLEHRHSRKRAIEVWNCSSAPRFDPGGRNRLFVACDARWEGFLILEPEPRLNLRDLRCPWALVFDARSWTSLDIDEPCKRFRGWTTKVPERIKPVAAPDAPTS
jgi:hypothetical protein